MSGWQFGGWPPPPPGQAGGVSFAAVKAALAVADSPVGFNGQRLTNIGEPIADTDAATRGFVEDTIAGPQYQNAPAPVTVAAGNSIDLPGPGLGLIRIYTKLWATSLGATPAFDISIGPTATPTTYVIGRAISAGAATALTKDLQSIFSPMLGNGEALRLANVGTASAIIWYESYDILATNRTLFRVKFGDTPQVVVPAAPVGSYYRMIQTFAPAQAASATSYTNAVHTNTNINNDDTAGAVLLVTRGGVLFGRNSTIAAGGNAFVVVGLNLGSYTEEIAIATAAPVATRQLVLTGGYELVTPAI